jgi:outer membrane receptor for ferrienterochelin and colicin
MGRKIWVTAATLGSLLAFASNTGAQDRSTDLTTLSLEDLLNVPILTATRSIQAASTAPAHVEVVTASEIERRGYESLLDVLRDLPGIKVDYAVDQDLFSDVTIQGTRGTLRLVVLLDGTRIVSPTAEPLPIIANYPVHNARQIEVVYGPASALYGADAFSAVINIITRDPGQGDRAQGSISSGQNGLWNTTGSYAATLSKRVDVWFGAQVLDDRQPDLTRSYPGDFNALTSHQTGEFNTIYGTMVAGPRVSPKYAMPLKAHSVQGGVRIGGWRLSLFQNAERAPNTPAYTPDNAVYNDIAFQQNELLVGAATYDRRVGRVDTNTTFTLSRHELDPASGYLNVFSGMQRSYKYAYGSSFRGEHQSTWKPVPSLSLAIGGDVERLRSIPQSADLAAPIADRRQPGIILGTTIPDELVDIRYVNAGAYVQSQWMLHPRVTLTGGIRADYNSRYDTVFNPRIGLVSPIAKGTTVKVMYGTAYLAPSPYQTYARFGAFYSVDDGATYQSDFWHVPNPQLKPQHKRTLEASVDRSLGHGVNVGASAFYSKFTDLVQEYDVTLRNSGLYRDWAVALLQESVNGGRETTYGGTVQVNYLVLPAPQHRIRLRSALSIADGRTKRADAPGGSIELGGMAPVLWQTLADVDLGNWTVAPRIVTVSDQRTLATEPDASGTLRRLTMDGYTVVDVTVRRHLARTPLTLFATADNLFDARYRNLNLRAYINPEEMVGSPQNPRRLTAGMQVRFR